MKLSEKKIREIEKESEHWGPGKRTKIPLRKVRKEEAGKILEKGGLQLITMRLPSDVIEKLKAMAAQEGIKYQPYLRKILILHSRNQVSPVEERLAKVESLVLQLMRKKTGT